MCTPAAIMTGMQIGVKMASTIVADQAQNQRAKATWASAQQDLLSKYTANQTRENQEAQRTQLEIIHADTQAQSNASRLRAQSAAGGVTGATVKERTAQPSVAASNFAESARMNLAAELSQNQLDAESFRAKAQSIINENPAVNPAAEALELGGEALGGAAEVGKTLGFAGNQ